MTETGLDLRKITAEEINDLSYPHGTRLLASEIRQALSSKEAEIAELRRERDAWIETARQHHANEQFYHGLVTQIGERFGEVAYTSDDGSIQQDVLALKVPELVRALEEQVKGMREALKPFAEEAAHWDGDAPDKRNLYGRTEDGEIEPTTLRLGDLRRAKSVLSPSVSAGGNGSSAAPARSSEQGAKLDTGGE